MATDDLNKILGLGSASVRKHYYKDLAEHEHKLHQFRFALDNFPEPIIFFDPHDFSLVDYNETFLSFFGVTDSTSVTFIELFPSDGRDAVMQAIRGDQHTLKTYIRPGNADIPVELIFKMTRFQGQDIAICLVSDISERIESENKLRASEELYKSLFQDAEFSRRQLEYVIKNSGTLIIALDSSGTVVETNIDQFPVFSQSIKGMNVFRDHFPPEYEGILSQFWETGQGRQDATVEVIGPKGRKYLYKVRTKRIHGQEAKLGYLVYGSDITSYTDSLNTLMPGNAYFHFSDQEKEVIELLRLMKQEYHVISFTRSPLHDTYPFSELIELLSDKNPIDAVYETVSRLVSEHPHSIIYFDRFDFIRCFSDFHGMMRLIYRLNDLIRSSGSLILYSIPHLIFSDAEIEFLRAECLHLTVDHSQASIDPKKLKLLQCLHESDAELNCSQLARKCDFSRKTVTLWAQELEKTGFVEAVRHGRSKYLRLGPQGKKYLE